MGNVARIGKHTPGADTNARRLGILAGLAQRACEYPDLRDLAALVYAYLHQELPADSFYLAQAQPHAEGLRGVLVIDEGVEYPPACLHVEPFDDPAATGPRLLAQQPTQQHRAFGNGRPSASCLICPMRAGGRVVGQVAVMSYTPDAFTADDARFLQSVADLITPAFDRQLLLQEVAQREEEIRAQVRGDLALSRLAGLAERINAAPDNLATVLGLVCEEAVGLLGIGQAAIYLLDPVERRLDLRARSDASGGLPIGSHIPLDDDASHAARAARERRMILEADLSGVADDTPPDVDGARSALTAPLLHHGVTFGALVLTDRRRRHAFHDDDLRLASALAGHAAAAAARAQIRAAEQERLHLAAVLATISASIGADADPPSIYELIVQQAATLIPFDEASITLVEEGTLAVSAAVGTALRHLPSDTAAVRLWLEPRNLDLLAWMGEPALARIVEAAGLGDLLSLPLLVNGVVVGRLTFGSRQRNRYETHQAQLAALLAERTAQVVRTVQLRAAHEAALAKLTQLDILRQEFVATVSHELRTPLTGILGYLEILIRRWDSLSEDRRRGMLERTKSSAARLEHLVTDLLLFSNLEHHQLSLQISSVPVASLAERAVSDIEIKYRDQAIEVRSAERQAEVKVDAQRAIQVIFNLLDNAIKFSDAGAPLHLRWMVRRAEVEVTVRDHGPGIQPEDMPRLFTRFGTLGHAPRPGQAGTGIGLYICKKLLEAMGGRIWATSRPGHGSTFHVALPRGTRP